MDEQNLDLIERERRRLLEDDLSKTDYGSEDSKRYLEDLKELSAMANEAKKLEIEEMKVKSEAELKTKALEQEAEDKAKERKTNRILGWIDAGAKIVVAGTAVVVCVLNNRFSEGALGEVLKYESGGEYISSMIGKSVIGGLFRKGK